MNLMPIFTDPKDINDRTDRAMIDGIKSQFPIEGKRFTLEATDIHVVKKDYTHKDEKKAILSSSSLTYPVKANLRLIDKATGKTLDTVQNFTLADTFYITPKHTLIYNGNNYGTANLLVRLPGVFVRHKNDGTLESEFNTGSGRSFSITLDPKTRVFYIEVEGSRVPLAAMLKTVMGISDQTILRYVPSEVWEANKQMTAGKDERQVNSLYGRFVSKSKQNKNASIDTKIEEIKAAIFKGQLSPITTQITLGAKKESMDPETFLLALKNIIAVYRGDKEEDNRDSLEFKRVQNLPDFIKLRFDKENETVTKAKAKIIFNMDRLPASVTPTIRDIISPKPYNKVFSDFIVSSTLSSTPTETNPVESIEAVAKVTLVAPREGGASDERSIPLDARNIHPSHLGIIDPSRTPESGSAGIDQRFTIAAKRDEQGILHTAVKDNSGKTKYISVQEMMRSTIGFPGQDKAGPNDLVHAQVRGKITEVPKKEVQYWIADSTHLYTITTNLVPFMNSSHPSRMTMAGKAITQALSLVDREEPLVQTTDEQGVPFVTRLGHVVSTTSPVDGTITEVAKDHIIIKGEDGQKHTIDFVRNLPFNMKGFMDDHPTTFKVGDKVHKGQVLADNNYTKGGKLALGRNLYAAYMPYKGFNHEDGIVISRSAATKLSSLHAYKYDYSLKQDTTANKALYRRYFPSDLTPEQLNMLDDKGIVKKGTRLKYGDPIYAFLEKRIPTEIDKALGRLDKILVKPYNKTLQRWDHDEVGEVVDVHGETADIKVVIRSVKPLEVGDKLTGLHGNKGIVSLVLEDHEMPHSREHGGPVDLLLNPASVTSRINLGQVMETGAAKIASKTGNPYLIKNFSKDINVSEVKKELEHHGLSDVDTVFDPKTGQEFGKIFAGPQYFLKLFKTTDSNYSARNVGGYDSYMQPSKGGEEGAKGVGYMEMLGLMGSDARKNLKEITTVKSEKNEEFWDKFMLGQPLPKPKTTFATRKLMDYLKAAGIHVREDNGHLTAAPMTDSDVLKLSNGKITNAGVIAAKNGQAEKGGIFDIAVTGGLHGEKWGHYTLAEPVVNPVFEKPVKALLGLKKEEYEGLVKGTLGIRKEEDGVYSLMSHEGKTLNTIITRPGIEVKKSGIVKAAFDPETGEELMTGGEAFRELLGDIHAENHLNAYLEEYKNSKSMTKKNKLIKKIKYLKGLSDMGVKDPASAYTLKHIPILPPIMRPVLDKGGNRFDYSDINKLYKEMILANEGVDKIKDFSLNKDMHKQRAELYDSVKAVVGMGEAVGPQSRKQGLKGVMVQLTGEEGPKGGMFHSRVLKKNQDMSGRATIYAAPDVGFNEAKFPKEMMWTMFKMHMLREMVKNGMTLAEAKQAYDKRTLAAQNVFARLSKTIPIMLNRPPTLMKTNIMAMYGIPVEGKTIGLNILHLPGFAADFDGDALTTYVPMTQEAIEEAKEKLLPSKHLSDARKGFGYSMFAPGHEAILGSVHLTKPDMSKPVMKFKTEAEALEALKSGRIEDNQPIEITG